MARIDWVHYGLENWARWKVSGGSGGRGRSVLTASTVFDMRVRDRSGYRAPSIPVTDHEAILMDRAMVDLQVKAELLHYTVVLAYLGHPRLGQLTRLGVAGVLGVSERTVHARLEQADRHLATWFRARADARVPSK